MVEPIPYTARMAGLLTLDEARRISCLFKRAPISWRIQVGTPEWRIELLELRSTAARSILWSALENASATLIAFISLVFFAKMLSPSDFGAFSVSLAVVEVAAIFTNMLFHDALIQGSDVTDVHFHGALTVSLVFSVAVYALLWIGFPSLAALVADDRIQGIGRVLGLGLLVTGPAGIIAARQSRGFGFRLLALRTLAGRLFGTVLGIACLFLGFGLWSLVIQHLSIVLLSSVTLFFCSSIHIRLTTTLRPIRDLLSFSLASITSLSAIFITKRIFVFSVGVFLGTEKTGILSLAFRLVDTVLAVSAGAISQVLLPTLSRLQDNRPRLLNAYKLTLKLAPTVLFPVFAGVGAIAPELIDLMFGGKWVAASPYVLILGMLTFVQVPRVPAIPLLSATGHLRDVAWINVAVLVYMIVAVTLTRPANEYIALAVWGGGEFLTFAGIALALRRRLNIPFGEQWSQIISPLAGAIGMVIVVQFTRDILPASQPLIWRLPELAVLAGVSYMAVMLTFGRRHMYPVAGMARLIFTRE